jgi:hypothetical protein
MLRRLCVRPVVWRTCERRLFPAFLAARKQFAQVDDFSAFRRRLFLWLDHGLDLASLHLLVHELHDFVLELVLEVVGLPFAGHVLDELLGHLQLVGTESCALYARGRQIQALERFHLVAPAQQVEHQRGT